MQMPDNTGRKVKGKIPLPFYTPTGFLVGMRGEWTPYEVFMVNDGKVCLYKNRWLIEFMRGGNLLNIWDKVKEEELYHGDTKDFFAEHRSLTCYFEKAERHETES